MQKSKLFIMNFLKGNFLIISYREIRLLEIDILTEIYKEDLKDGILSIDI